MRKLFMLICILFIRSINAQNLVNNPSFETYSICPWAYSQMSASLGWDSNYGTCDYFNPCSTNLAVSVPRNGIGNQFAATGQSYAGFYAFLKSGYHTINGIYREYLNTRLISPLQPGTRYYLSMKVSLAEIWADTDSGTPWDRSAATASVFSGGIGCNKIGMKFFSTTDQPFFQAMYQAPCPLLNNSAHLYSQNVITDTTAWTIIHGSFVADSAYTYLVIGNFFNDNLMDTAGRPLARASYYFVDDVSVSTDSTFIVGIEPILPLKNTISVFPNPASTTLTIQSPEEYSDAGIYNHLGIEVKRVTLNPRNSTFDVSELPDGIYFFYLYRLNGRLVERLKFVKQH